MVSGSSSETGRGGQNRPPVTYTNIFEELCPSFMAMGMSYAEFWDGDCTIVKSYRKKDEIEQERRNEYAWLQGLYIGEAIASVLDTKHRVKYPKEPYALKTSVSKERAKKEQESNERKSFDYMMTMMAHLNKKFEKPAKGRKINAR